MTEKPYDASPEALIAVWHELLTDAREGKQVISVYLKGGSLHAGRVLDVGTSTFGLENEEIFGSFEHVIALTEVAAITWKRAED